MRIKFFSKIDARYTIVRSEHLFKYFKKLIIRVRSSDA